MSVQLSSRLIPPSFRCSFRVVFGRCYLGCTGYSHHTTPPFLLFPGPQTDGEPYGAVEELYKVSQSRPK